MGLEKGIGLEKRYGRWKNRAWHWEKGAWCGAMLKGAGGNTTNQILSSRMVASNAMLAKISGNDYKLDIT